MNNKTIAIDFDGTICKKQAYADGKIWEKPNEGAAKALTSLKEDGYKIVVYTVRLSPDKALLDYDEKRLRIKCWMKLHKIPFDDIVGHKPSAMAYIDDRAIRFTNWHDISNYFLQ